MKILVCLGLCCLHMPSGPPEASLPISFLEISWGMWPTSLSWGHERNSPCSVFLYWSLKEQGSQGLTVGRRRQHLWESGAHLLIPEQAKWEYTGMLHEEKGSLAMLFQDNNHSGWWLAFLARLIFWTLFLLCYGSGSSFTVSTQPWVECLWLRDPPWLCGTLQKHKLQGSRLFTDVQAWLLTWLFSEDIVVPEADVAISPSRESPWSFFSFG